MFNHFLESYKTYMYSFVIASTAGLYKMMKY